MFAKLIRWLRKMLGLSINLTTTRVGGLAAIPGATGSASFLDGAGATVTAPILGQPLFIAPGTFSGTPTVYDYQVYADSVAIGDATGTWDAADPAPSYIPTDDLVGAALVVKCHGRNSSGTSPTTNDSAATSALADISLTNAITAFSRTSASGVTPMLWSATLGSNVYEGYTLRAKVYSDAGLSTIVQNVALVLGHDDVQPAADLSASLTTAGLTAPSALQWLQLGIEATSPNNIGHSFSYPTPISPTDASGNRYWKLNFTADNGAGAILLREIKMATSSGGSNVAPGHTYTYHVDAGIGNATFAASKFFDNDVNQNGGLADAAYPLYIIIDFGSVVDLHELKLYSHGTYSTAVPTAFSFASSSDNITYNSPVISPSGLTWTSDEIKTWSW